MKFEDQRELMVSRHLIARGITDENILKAFLKVEREKFVPDYLNNYAYNDSALGIGNDQTISQPFIVAQMLELLDLEKNDTVLEIGTGSGYQTAILAEIVNKVYTVERIEELGTKAKEILNEMGYENIVFSVSDGTLGWNSEEICFDKIVVSAAAPKIPVALLKQLKNHGKLIIPCGNKQFQELELISKDGTKIKHELHGSCAFVPLIGKDGWER